MQASVRGTAMRGWGAAAGAVALALGIGAAASPDGDDWMYPARGGPAPAVTDIHTLPGSTLKPTTSQLHDLSEAVDWFPDRHPPAPTIVLHGHGNALACGFCHMPDGHGRPENAALAGLPPSYIEAQVADMAGGVRNETRSAWFPITTMRGVAAAASREETAGAAAYYAKLPFRSHVRVVEATDIPAVVQAGFVYRTVPGAGSEPLGERIVETPDDSESFELRDPAATYTAYVPPGAVARGRALAHTGGDGLTQPCAICHGPGLRGALGPPIAGRYPTYLFRQLHSFHAGARHGETGAPMTAVTARLTDRDMIDLAAYAASLKP